MFMYLRGEPDTSLALILYEISLSILRVKIDQKQVSFLLSISNNFIDKKLIQEMSHDPEYVDKVFFLLRFCRIAS